MNWTAINETLVRTGKLNVLLNTAQAQAAAASQADPLPEWIADVTATIRSAVSTGNVLDLDTTKIPNSLKALALRMVGRRVKAYLDRALNTDEQAQARTDDSYLNRIIDSKIKFELPDTPAPGDGEMQGAGGVAALNVPCRQVTKCSQSRL
jgi:hypothetical protein